MTRCFLNVDAGESPVEPEELFSLAALANIACGGHVGDQASMARAVFRCAKHGTRVGAHPSYPDRANFGRASIAMDANALRATVAEQCTRLRAIAEAHNVRVLYAKLHGALYHDANRSLELACACLAGACEALGREITIVGPANGELARAASDLAIPYAREGFADRAMRSDGSLIPRSEAGALIESPSQAAAQARYLRTRVDTICVHSDTAGAVEIARAVRDELAL
ncbi:MAG: LamB/YcsF family protein [Sandaracinaceae bacterium]|nr:LamB/YcsF family protein [Sandaracinaceae bacterium]